MSGERQHIVTVKLHRAWNEYRADCSCGHTGSYFPRREHAVREGEIHARTGASPVQH